MGIDKNDDSANYGAINENGVFANLVAQFSIIGEKTIVKMPVMP